MMGRARLQCKKEATRGLGGLKLDRRQKQTPKIKIIYEQCYHRNLRVLAIEMYKVSHDQSLQFMKDIVEQIDTKYCT